MNRAVKAKTFPFAVMVASAIYGMAMARAADETAITGIAWTCSQERDTYFHVQCTPQPVRAGGDAVADDGKPRNDDAVREPAPSFRGHDMRPVTARGVPEVFSTKAWRIPLYSQPGNPAAIVNLLDSVLCGGAAQCTVTYSGFPGIPY